MTNTIKLKRGTSTPTTSNISNGEVAIDTSNQKLYINDSGTVKEIGGGGSIGGSSGIDFNDDVKVRLGTGNDLEIYHSGSHAFIENVGDGYLFLNNTDANIYLRPKSGEDGIIAKTNSSVELYYDNSKKLETTSAGITVTGEVSLTGGVIHLGTADSSSGHINAYENMTFNIDTDNDDTNRTFKFLYNGESGSGTTILELNESKNVLIPNDSAQLQLGASQDLKIFHDGSNSFVDDTGTGYLRVRGSEVRLQKTSSAEDMLRGIADGAVELYYDNSKKFSTNSGGVEVQDRVYITGAEGAEAKVIFQADEGDDNADTWKIEADTSGGLNISNYAGGSYEKNIECNGNGNVELYYDNSKKFNTDSGGAQVFGVLRFDDGSSSTNQINFGNSADLKIYHDGNHSQISDTGTGNLQLLTSAFKALSSDGSEAYISAVRDGAVELYYDNSKKLETNSAGITIDGDATFTGVNYNIFWDKSANALKFTDNSKAIFGDHSGTGDLHIYSDGTNGLILSDALRLKNESGGDVYLKADSGGAVELYHNDVKRFETTSAGIKVTGNLVPEADNTRNLGDGSANFNSIWASTRFRGNDNVKLVLGSSQDLVIRHDGTNNLIESPVGGDIKIMAGTGDNASETCATFNHDGNVELYYDNSRKLYTVSDGAITTGHHQLTNGNLYLNDSYAVRCGNSGDLQIYHDGSNSYLYQNGTGELRANAAAFRVMDRNGGETQLLASENGAVELYYDNSKKLHTRTDGIEVTGVVSASDHIYLPDDKKLRLGNAPDLEIYHDSSSGQSIIAESGPSVLKIKASDFRISNSANSADYVQANDGGAVKLFYNGSNKFETTSAGATLTGDLLVSAGIKATTNYAGDDNVKLKLGNGDDLQLYHDGSNSFIDNGTGALSLIAANDVVHKIHSDGTFDIGFQSDNVQLRLGAGSDLKIYHDGSHSYIKDAGTGTLRIEASEAGILSADGSETMAQFVQNGAVSLRYDNSTKLETHTNGVTVTGRISVSGNSGVGLIHGDSVKAVFGDSDDLQIYHDGTYNKITLGGKELQILGGGSNNKKIIVANTSNAAELYYDNSKKLHTHSGGITVSGSVHMDDNNKYYAGTGDDFFFYHNGTSNYVESNNGVIHLRSNHGMQFDTTGSGNTWLKCNTSNSGNNSSSTNVELYYANSKRFETGPGYNLSTGDMSPSATGTYNLGGTSAKWNNAYFAGNIYLYDADKIILGDSGDLQISHNTNNYISYSNAPLLITGDGTNEVRIQPKSDEYSARFQANSGVYLYYNGSKKFETQANGVTVTGGVYSDGLICGDNEKVELGDSADLKIWHDGGNAKTVSYTGNYHTEAPSGLYNYRPTGTAGYGITHWQSDVGGTAAVKAYVKADGDYHNASDYRLKQDIVEITNGIATVKQLKPSTFRWKADTSQTKYGFIAHELQEVVPDIVTGEKDGAETQFVCKESLIAVLAAALKESIAKIETLETKVLALESA